MLFLSAIGTVAIGGWSAASREIPATFSCWDLKDFEGHAYKFNSCTGIVENEGLTTAGASAGPVAAANGPPPLSPLLSPVRPFDQTDGIFVRLVALADKYGVAITAIATILLAFVTAGLVWVGGRQIRTSRAQLRAYVFLESSEINDTDAGKQPKAHIVIKNFGQTPAYQLRLVGGMGTAETFAALPPATGDPRGTFGVLAPTGTFHFFITAPGALSNELAGALIDGRTTLFVYGEANYQDAFGKPRKTKFRTMFGGPAGTQNKRLASCQEGNEAD